MKFTLLCACWMLAALLVSVPAAAQEEGVVSPNMFTVLFVPIESAEKPGDAIQLNEAMVGEISWTGELSGRYKLVESRGMRGSLPPSSGSLSPQDLAAEPKYVITGELISEEADTIFQVSLWRMGEPNPMASEELAYGNVDDALGFIPFFMWSLFAILPDEDRITKPDIAWKRNWLEFGLRLGASPRFYQPASSDGPNAQYFGFDIGAQAEFQFFSADHGLWGASVMMEIAYSRDKAAYWDWEWHPTGGPGGSGWAERVSASYDSGSLMVPVLIKLNYRPDRFVVAPYAGLYYSLFLPSESGYSMSPAIGLSAGVELGLHLGPGVLFFDARFSRDIGKTTIETDVPGVPEISYRRNILAFSLGYKIGFFSREDKTPEKKSDYPAAEYPAAEYPDE